ncbi:MAG: DUF1275 domain-containing protein [Eubacterium sp.]|nr:DUF1275 domain-containing protein [Eubacterium sp.]
MQDTAESKLNMLRRFLHHNMAAFAGFLGAYALLLREDFFGNAQTVNAIYIVFALIGKDLKDFMLRVIVLLLYVAATLLYVYIDRKLHKDTRMLALVINTVAVVVLALMPKDVNSVIGLYPIFFAMSFQWNSYCSVYGYNSSSIFSTNNIRQTALAFGEYLVDGDKKHLHKMVFFLGVLIFFHIGVGYGFITTLKFAEQAVWFDLVFIVSGAVLLYLVKKYEKEEQ